MDRAFGFGVGGGGGAFSFFLTGCSCCMFGGCREKNINITLNGLTSTPPWTELSPEPLSAAWPGSTPPSSPCRHLWRGGGSSHSHCIITHCEGSERWGTAFPGPDSQTDTDSRWEEQCNRYSSTLWNTSPSPGLLPSSPMVTDLIKLSDQIFNSIFFQYNRILVASTVCFWFLR